MRELQIGRVYRHFKGDYYLVEGVANDSETGVPFDVFEQGGERKIPGLPAGVPF